MTQSAHHGSQQGQVAAQGAKVPCEMWSQRAIRSSRARRDARPRSAAEAIRDRPAGAARGAQPPQLWFRRSRWMSRTLRGHGGGAAQGAAESSTVRQLGGRTTRRPPTRVSAHAPSGMRQAHQSRSCPHGSRQRCRIAPWPLALASAVWLRASIPCRRARTHGPRPCGSHRCPDGSGSLGLARR